MNRLFVAYKPLGISSNNYLRRLKWKYNTKKAGFSGTLDPFAKGVLIVAFGTFTRFFRFLKKTPKRYRATLWLGVNSPSLDNENIDSIEDVKVFDEVQIKESIEKLKGEISYHPPKYCAKKIDGKRAYELARAGEEVVLKSITSTVYDIEFLHYRHPFVSFEVSISEGGYIRSIGHIIAQSLEVNGTLSSLERLSEGMFTFDDEKPLNWLEHLSIEENFYIGDVENLEFGRKLDINDIKIKENGQYYVQYHEKFAIIELTEQKVSYLINGIMREAKGS